VSRQTDNTETHVTQMQTYSSQHLANLPVQSNETKTDKAKWQR